MKIFTLCILSTLLFYFGSNAQTLTPVKSTIEHNEQIRACLMVKLDPEPKTLKNAWIDYLDNQYDFKLKGMGLFSNKELLTAEEVSIPKISSKKMNFYTNVVEDGDGSEMKVFASLGYDIYLNDEKYPAEFNSIKEIMTAFLKQYLPQYYKEVIEESSEKVKGLTEEIKDINDDIKDKEDDIEKLRKEIDEHKKNVLEKSSQLQEAEIKLRGNQDKMERIGAMLQKL